MEINTKLAKIAGGIVATVTLITSIFVVDDRWNNDKVVSRLEAMENNLLDEFRDEVGINRGALISILQRDIDDLEFEISQSESAGENVPRIKIERLKQTERLLEVIKKDESISNNSN